MNQTPKRQTGSEKEQNSKKRNYVNQSLVKRILGQDYTLEKRLPLEGMKKILIPSTVKEYRKEGNKDCVYLYEKGKSK